VTSLVVWLHPGLGDHLICNGLVNCLADEHDVIYLPCKPQYLGMLRSLYAERPTVQPFAVCDWSTEVDRFGREKGCAVIRVGHEHTDAARFDESFYRQLNIPFEMRYTRFALPSMIPHEEELFARLAPRGDYCLVHRESSRGIFELAFDSPLPVVHVERRTDPFNNVLAYRKLICRAAEIHCINSSVIHLVDGLPSTARLFYHEVKATDFTLRPVWTIVPYSTRRVRRYWRQAAARARLLRAPR
jgi:hypothetical protein